jgi:hypothetical protein
VRPVRCPRRGQWYQLFKTDTPHFAGQSVRSLAEDPATGFAKLLVDSHRQRRGEAKSLQGSHNLPNMALLHPSGGNALGADRPDAWDVAQPRRVCIDQR